LGAGIYLHNLLISLFKIDKTNEAKLVKIGLNAHKLNHFSIDLFQAESN